MLIGCAFNYDAQHGRVPIFEVRMNADLLRRRAYWLSLQQGFSKRAGQQTVTVRIPESNLLDVDALRDLMERSRSGGI